MFYKTRSGGPLRRAEAGRRAGTPHVAPTRVVAPRTVRRELALEAAVAHADIDVDLALISVLIVRLAVVLIIVRGVVVVGVVARLVAVVIVRRAAGHQHGGNERERSCL